MPTNERINKQKEAKRRKDQKTKNIIWSVLLIIIFVLVIMKVCEIDYTDLKNKIVNFSSPSSSSAQSEYPTNLNMMSTAEIIVSNEKLQVLTEASVSIINPSNANVSYSYDHGYTNPIMCSAGNYICLYDQGGTRFRLDTQSENLYEMSLDKSIITACVSRDGTIAYSVFDDNNKSRLVVINKREKKKMDLPISDGYVTSIALDPSGSRCVYVTVDSVNADLVTKVHTIDVSDTKDTAVFEYPNSNIIGISYLNNNAYIIGDDFLSILRTQKKKIDVFAPGTIETQRYCFNKSGEIILNYVEYSNSTNSKISYISNGGKIKSTFSLSEAPKYISCRSNDITVLYANRIAEYDIKGIEKKSVSCDSSTNSVQSIGSKYYVQYGQYLDAIKKG